MIRRFDLLWVVAVTAMLAPACAGKPAAHGNASSASSASPALGEAAEELYDTAWASKWGDLEKHLAAVRAAAEQVNNDRTVDATLAGRVRELVATLDAAASRKDRNAVLASANELTRVALSLSAPPPGAPPREIWLLDVEGRALCMAADRGDTAGVHAALTEIKKVWAVAKPDVLANGGDRQAAAFDRRISALDGATTPASVAPLADKLLDEVDVLEKVYPHK